jgi:adenylate cyclase
VLVGLTEADFRAAGLLDPKDPKAPERLALLQYLDSLGIGLEQMVEAHQTGSLAGLPAEAEILPGKERLDAAELARRAGVSEQLVDTLRRAAGLPPVAPGELAFTEEDVKTYAAFSFAASIFGEEPILQYARVLGSSMARLAEAAISLFLGQLSATMRDADELTVAKANLRAAGALAHVPQVMDNLFRLHLAAALRRLVAARRDPDSYDTAWFAVGFVDLVGFTPLAEELPTRELAGLIEDFEARAFHVVAAQDGRVVKLIGDEVMFVTQRAEGACEVALSLLEGFGGAGSLVAPRGGLAFGEVLVRGGDYYGSTVNLASRIAELAIPNEVLTLASLETQLDPEARSRFCFEPAGRRLLKGFSKPVQLTALSRAAPASA